MEIRRSSHSIAKITSSRLRAYHQSFYTWLFFSSSFFIQVFIFRRLFSFLPSLFFFFFSWVVVVGGRESCNNYRYHRSFCEFLFFVIYIYLLVFLFHSSVLPFISQPICLFICPSIFLLLCYHPYLFFPFNFTLLFEPELIIYESV